MNNLCNSLCHLLWPFSPPSFRFRPSHLYSLNYDTFSWGILVLFNFQLYLNGWENWGKFIAVSLEAGESKECGAEDKEIFRKLFKVGRGQDLNGNGTAWMKAVHQDLFQGREYETPTILLTVHWISSPKFAPQQCSNDFRKRKWSLPTSRTRAEAFLNIHTQKFHAVTCPW